MNVKKMATRLIVLAFVCLALAALGFFLDNMNAFVLALIAAIILMSMGCSAGEIYYKNRRRK